MYAICASNDIAVKMMHDNGPALTQEVIDEAVDFRQALARLYRSHKDNSRCIVLVNISKKTWQGEVKLAAADGGESVKMQVAPHDIVWKIIR